GADLRLPRLVDAAHAADPEQPRDAVGPDRGAEQAVITRRGERPAIDGTMPGHRLRRTTLGTDVHRASVAGTSGGSRSVDRSGCALPRSARAGPAVIASECGGGRGRRNSLV